MCSAWWASLIRKLPLNIVKKKSEPLKKIFQLIKEISVFHAPIKFRASKCWKIGLFLFPFIIAQTKCAKIKGIKVLYLWMPVNIHENIRKWEFDINFIPKAFNLAKQTPLRMFSCCPEISRATYFCVSPNRWFGHRRKDSNKDSFMQVSGFWTVVFKLAAGTRNNYRRFGSVFSFYFERWRKKLFLGFYQIGTIKQFTKFTWKQLNRIHFSIKLQASYCDWEETPAQAFSYEFCEILWSTFLMQHFQETAFKMSKGVLEKCFIL